MMLGLGVREIVAGLGILGQKKPSGWVWARLAGDVMDMSYTGYGLASGRAKDRTRAMATLASLIGVTARRTPSTSSTTSWTTARRSC